MFKFLPMQSLLCEFSGISEEHWQAKAKEPRETRGAHATIPSQLELSILKDALLGQKNPKCILIRSRDHSSVYCSLAWLLVHVDHFKPIEAKDKIMFTTELRSYYLETG